MHMLIDALCAGFSCNIRGFGSVASLFQQAEGAALPLGHPVLPRGQQVRSPAVHYLECVSIKADVQHTTALCDVLASVRAMCGPPVVVQTFDELVSLPNKEFVLTTRSLNGLVILLSTARDKAKLRLGDRASSAETTLAYASAAFGVGSNQRPPSPAVGFSCSMSHLRQ